MKTRIFKTVLALFLCLLMASFTVLSCFAEVTYDTNSVNKFTSSNANGAYFTDKTYYNVRRILSIHHSNYLTTVARLEADNTPQYTTFLLSYGQTLYYRIGKTEHPEKVIGNFTVEANGANYTDMYDMYNTFNGKTVKKVLGWYNCQPKTSSGNLIADNHYCIITKPL